MICANSAKKCLALAAHLNETQPDTHKPSGNLCPAVLRLSLSTVSIVCLSHFGPFPVEESEQVEQKSTVCEEAQHGCTSCQRAAERQLLGTAAVEVFTQ